MDMHTLGMVTLIVLLALACLWAWLEFTNKRK
jgi:hypothetical protein